MSNQRKSVAIIGASANPEKFGNRAVLAFREKGYLVYPVNPRESAHPSSACTCRRQH